MRIWLGLCAIGLAACSDGNATFQVRESVNQLHVTHASPGSTLTVVDATNATVATGTADDLGSFVFRKLAPGTGYRVKALETSQTSRHLRVVSVDESQPQPSFYSGQKLVKGFQYIITRDGTTLSAYVTMPGDPSQGPYPTVIDYSGYEPSQPGGPVANGNFSYLCGDVPTLCDAPNDPAATLAGIMGFATVSVNIRGTGCSGGAYDYFETLQLLDGYDVIETVAAQPWVQGGKVGMVGISYPGISQLFVGSTRPPHLAAIAPLSVIGNTATTMLPGGILNDGFALEWVTQVLDRAAPYGQGWEQGLVDAGDLQCAENQLLHNQRVDNTKQAETTPYYVPELIDPLNPTKWVDQIQVPVFLAGAWQDEQTGPFFSTLMDKFTGAPSVRMTVYNGVHEDAFQPQVLAEWKAFLDIYVANKVPQVPDVVRTLAPVLFDNIFHAQLSLPPDRWAGVGTVDAARGQWESEPSLRVIFESGAQPSNAAIRGAPGGTFEQTFAAWPPAGQTPQRWYFQTDGSMASTPPGDASAASSFDFDPAAGTRGILAPGGDVWDQLPAYDWQPPQAGKAVIFESPPLGADQLLIGTASADLWVSSTANDADLQVTIIEVRPDAQEIYVQSGWLRTSLRALGSDSTDLWPSPTYLQADESLLTPGQWVQARVPIAGFSHAFRAGSRIRVLVDTPGGERAEWRFRNKTFATAPTHSIGHDASHPSSIALPLIGGAAVPTPMPACPSLRGQPCRLYVPFVNRPAN